MIRVLVAEDSPTVRALLVEILENDPAISVVGQAKDGREAVELAARLRPDLVTMDINMPHLDGLEATKEIMIRSPTPILIVSSRASQQEINLSLNATRAGALMVLPTPDNPLSEAFDETAEQLLELVKTLAQVKVVRQWAPGTRPRRDAEVHAPPRPPAAVELVAIAGSTGGPAALQRILMDLPRTFPAPILIVQHIAPGFVEGLCTWLAGSCDLRVRIAEEGERLQPQTVYLAADDRHLGVRNGRILLSEAPPIDGFRPSASFLFESAARAYGAAVTGVILTGMGRDGVAGLRALHGAGGTVLAQDEHTSVIYGMPGEALRAGVVDSVLPVQEIASRLVQLTQGEPS